MRYCITAVLFFIVLGASLAASDFTLDFTNTDSITAVTESGIELNDAGLGNRAILPAGTYEIILPSSNRVIVPAVEGRVDAEHQDDKEVSDVELKTRKMTLLEANVLVSSFSELFSLDIEDKYQAWVDPLEKGKLPRDFFGIESKSQYPSIGISAHYSFTQDRPIFVLLKISWTNWLHQRRGTSPESNTLQNFTFDVPKILASVNPEAVDVPAAEPPEPAPEPEKVYEEREPVEVVFDEVEEHEPSEEPVEKSSNWCLWLIGAVVVVGGIGLIARRKS